MGRRGSPGDLDPYLLTMQSKLCSQTLKPIYKKHFEKSVWKTKESIKTMYLQHSLKVFQRYFKKDTKAWIWPVRLIYSHSFSHNIISDCTGVNLYRTENNLSNVCNYEGEWTGNVSLLIAWDYFTSKRNPQLPCAMEVKLWRTHILVEKLIYNDIFALVEMTKAFMKTR